MIIPIPQMRKREPGMVKHLPEATPLLSGEQGLDHESRDSSGDKAKGRSPGLASRVGAGQTKDGARD